MHLHTLKQLKSMDTIELPDNLVDKIIEKYNHENITRFCFFLEEGVQKYYIPQIEVTNYTYFKLGDNSISIAAYIAKGKQLAPLFAAEVYITRTTKTLKPGCRIIKTTKGARGKESIVIATFLSVFAYLAELIDSRETVVKETQRRVEVISGKRKKKKDKKRNFINKRVVSLTADRTEYITITTDPDTSNEKIDKLAKRQYKRHAESWTVRGHVRRYKSGKVVYIKPYNKGKGKKKPKTYRP